MCAFGNNTQLSAVETEELIVAGNFIAELGDSPRIISFDDSGNINNSFVAKFDVPVRSMVYQSDGKILCGESNVSPFHEWLMSSIFRLNTDGTIDNSFASGEGFNSPISSIKLQSDGKILCVGGFTSYNSISITRMARLNADGSLDSSFVVGSGFNDAVSDVAIQSDGKMICVGSFTMYNNVSCGRIVRIHPNGTIDNSFMSGSGFSGTTTLGNSPSPSKIIIQNDQKILCVGNFTSYNNISSSGIIRLNNDGSIDNSFVVGNGFVGSFGSPSVNDAAIQSDGKIICVGRMTQYQEVIINNIIRLNSNGSIDNTFDVGSSSLTGFNNTVDKVLIQNNGKILLGGVFTSYKNNETNSICRLNTDGSIDLSFRGQLFGGSILNIIDTGSSIICCGSFLYYNKTQINRIINIYNQGLINNNFNIGSGFNNTVNATSIGGLEFKPPGVCCIVKQHDGKFVCAGTFNRYNNTQITGDIVRINIDGTIDNNFITDSVLSSKIGNMSTLLVQPDNKILCAGAFNIVRLNADGSTDNSFNTGSGFNGRVDCIVILNDGKIIAGGTFTNYNGLTSNRIVKLNTNGTIDTSFSIGSGFDGRVTALTLQKDGKILCGGSFSNYNNISSKGIVRLHDNGAIDTSFIVGTGFTSTFVGPSGTNMPCSKIIIQNDDKIICAYNDYNKYNNIDIGRIIRLNTDGSLDSSFSNMIINTICDVALQKNGKIICAGIGKDLSFGYRKLGLVRLNINGTIDTAFNFNVNNTVNSIQII